MFGLSCYVWNFKRTVKLTRLVKEKYPDCLIIVGGPSVPTSERNYFKDFPHVDILVKGEGEITFQRILQRVISGSPTLHEIKGVIFRENGQTVETGEGELLPNDFDYPSPYLLNYFEDNIRELDERGIERECLIETSRGCPYNCMYCYEGNYGREFRRVGWNHVCKDIEYVGPEMDRITVIDTNFGILERDVSIAEMLVEQISKYRRINAYHISHAKSSNVKVQDRLIEIAEIFESENYFKYTEGVEISLQTLTKNVLSSISRRNPEVDSFRSFQNRLNDKGIPHHIELIVGLPDETMESMFDVYEAVLEGKPKDVRLYALMVLPNTKLNTKRIREEYKLDTRIACSFEGVESDEDEYLEQVIATKDFPKEDLMRFLEWRELFQYTYFGKWTYFISEYLNRTIGLRRVDFHRDLMKFSYKNKESILEKCLNKWYIINWNSGSFVKFKGPISPYNIEWGDRYFNKNTFHWLCISTNREEFYSQLKEFILTIAWDPIIEDLLKFQEGAVIKFNFDPSLREGLNYKYNWFEHFHASRPLVEGKNEIVYTTKYKTSDPENFFLQAGGHPQFFQKIKAFIHRDAEINYSNGDKVLYKSNLVTGKPIWQQSNK